MPRHRVVVTGLGVVSSIGYGATNFAEALRAGKSGTARIRSFDTTGFPHEMGCEVLDFDPKAWLKRLDPATCARPGLFAAAAARMAVDDAQIDPEVLVGSETGSSVGTTLGNNGLLEPLTAEWLERGPAGLTPSIVRQVANRVAVAVNRELELTGEAITLSTACSAGNYAIGYAYDRIHSGEADYMLCGGADGGIRRFVHAGFLRLGAVSHLMCQPFDKNRQGILMGEGSGMLFLETLESAQARGARIYAEVLGYGLNCDAKHITAPDPVSIAACMRRAHAHAGITPDDVDYICAHGTGTKVNDAVEMAAIHEVFGHRIPPVSSIKSMIGHTMGAASAHGAVACALAIYYGFLPPTINFQEPDPACEVDCVPNFARAASVNVVQNNGFAFGGNNAITILGRDTWVSQHLQ